ncbi:MAG: flagellar biosynthesis protein FlhF [Proteobacteria bacterium]|nr:flagellar biosynthesis protein FlhF [Pseudomonadota bacterium]HQR05103.1 flagellar biosynthesis protein FlhF [Rhodocyclaceae bacterium]
MTIKRFFAESARECLRRVKEELGPDAIVVSNKAVTGGVEITAMSADSLDALSRQAVNPVRAVGNGVPVKTLSSPPVVGGDDDYTVSLSPRVRKQPAFRDWQPPAVTAAVASRPNPLQPRDMAEAAHARVPVPPVPPAVVPGERPVQPAPSPAHVREKAVDADAQVDHLMKEMQTIRGMLEQQLAGFAWGDLSRNAPARALLLSEMLAAGFSGQLARRVAQELPVDVAIDEGRKRLMVGVNRRLRTLGNEGDLIDRGGVYALVGPTGVGKTTTTAKLAARCVVRYGAERVALLTTDTYRIGAHEQLRIYGRILGVPVHVVRDGDDLQHTLADLREKHMVLIDTVGMSQRDRMVAEQAAMLMRSGDVSRLLLLNATSRGDTLDDVIRAYAGEDLAGCLLTKVDETASLAPVLDAVIRHGLLLSYVTNGQRVPEDLHLPNRNYLLHRAFKQPVPGSPHRLRENEVGMLLNARAQEPSRKEGSLG